MNELIIGLSSWFTIFLWVVGRLSCASGIKHSDENSKAYGLLWYINVVTLFPIIFIISFFLWYYIPY